MDGEKVSIDYQEEYEKEHDKLCRMQEKCAGYCSENEKLIDENNILKAQIEMVNIIFWKG